MPRAQAGFPRAAFSLSFPVTDDMLLRGETQMERYRFADGVGDDFRVVRRA
jgi:hypothetical protein